MIVAEAPARWRGSGGNSVEEQYLHRGGFGDGTAK